MKIYLSTSIDKFKGQFPKDFSIAPRIGEMVRIINWHSNPLKLPFNELQVKNVTYDDARNITVELHLSELQYRQMREYKINVFD